MILRWGIGAGVLIVGYAGLRFAAVMVGTARSSTSGLAAGPSATDLPAVATVLLPLALVSAAFVLAVVTAGRRRWQAASGAVLLAAAALIWVDSAIGALPVPYGARDFVGLFSLDPISPTAALPRPMPAVAAALRLLGAALVVTGLTRSPPRPLPAREHP